MEVSQHDGLHLSWGRLLHCPCALQLPAGDHDPLSSLPRRILQYGRLRMWNRYRSLESMISPAKNTKVITKTSSQLRPKLLLQMALGNRLSGIWSIPVARALGGRPSRRLTKLDKRSPIIAVPPTTKPMSQPLNSSRDYGRPNRTDHPTHSFRPAEQRPSVKPQCAEVQWLRRTSAENVSRYDRRAVCDGDQD